MVGFSWLTATASVTTGRMCSRCAKERSSRSRTARAPGELRRGFALPSASSSHPISVALAGCQRASWHILSAHPQAEPAPTPARVARNGEIPGVATGSALPRRSGIAHMPVPSVHAGSHMPPAVRMVCTPCRSGSSHGYPSVHVSCEDRTQSEWPRRKRTTLQIDMFLRPREAPEPALRRTNCAVSHTHPSAHGRGVDFGLVEKDRADARSDRELRSGLRLSVCAASASRRAQSVRLRRRA